MSPRNVIGNVLLAVPMLAAVGVLGGVLWFIVSQAFLGNPVAIGSAVFLVVVACGVTGAMLTEEKPKTQSPTPRRDEPKPLRVVKR